MLNERQHSLTGFSHHALLGGFFHAKIDWPGAQVLAQPVIILVALPESDKTTSRVEDARKFYFCLFPQPKV
jgi:hypothetical protein